MRKIQNVVLKPLVKLLYKEFDLAGIFGKVFGMFRKVKTLIIISLLCIIHNLNNYYF
jgi:hypothetical protein